MEIHSPAPEFVNPMKLTVRMVYVIIPLGTQGYPRTLRGCVNHNLINLFESRSPFILKIKRIIFLGFAVIFGVCLAIGTQAPSLWAASGSSGTAGAPDIERLYKKYQSVLDQYKAPSPPAAVRDAECPGWIVGDWAEPPKELFCQKWPYRRTTYEIYFSEKKEIARSIYGLALFTKDLDPSVTLERFERGAGGFHYSIGQITSWANAVLQGVQPTYTDEEKTLLEKLVADYILIRINGRYVSIGLAAHVLGVAPQTKRSLSLNLNHERLHVMWDENPKFREGAIAKWRTMSETEKQAVYSSLKGYNPENEMQIIEEWAVRQHENIPVEQWK